MPWNDSAIASATYSIGDFTIAASPGSLSTLPNGSVSYTISTTGTGGFTGAESFSVTGLPAGASASFSPTTVSGSGAQ